MEKVLEYAKAIVAAVAAAAIAALAEVDWEAIIGAAVASGGLTWLTPNRRPYQEKYQSEPQAVRGAHASTAGKPANRKTPL